MLVVLYYTVVHEANKGAFAALFGNNADTHRATSSSPFFGGWLDATSADLTLPRSFSLFLYITYLFLFSLYTYTLWLFLILSVSVSLFHIAWSHGALVCVCLYSALIKVIDPPPSPSPAYTRVAYTFSKSSVCF